MDEIADEIMSILNEAERVRKAKKITGTKMVEQGGRCCWSWFTWKRGRVYPTLYPLLICLHALGLDLKLVKYKGDSNQ